MTQEEHSQLTFEQLFRRVVAKHGLSQNKFAQAANVDQSVVANARSGKEPILELSAIKIMAAINRLLGTDYQYEDVAGLRVRKYEDRGK